MILTIIKFLVPTLVLTLALFLGWLNSTPFPEATLFAMVYPAFKGYIPPVITGGFSECPVVPLPDDAIRLEPRPTNEQFVTLPGWTPPPPEEGQEQVTQVPTRYQIPQQGIGMCCRASAYDPESVRRTILWYLKVGGRHIDTADLYLNHEWIGEALQTAMKDYNIPRDEIWITTKIWPRHYGHNSTVTAIHRMLKELQLDYVDMVLMHAPGNTFKFLGKKAECEERNLSAKDCRQETWKALSSLTNQKVIRHIGVSNMNIRQMSELLEVENVAPFANHQMQYNPWMPEEVHETFDFCQEHGISVTAWSSFSGSSFQHMEAFSVETLQKIAKNHNNCPVSQVLLKWALQRGAIVIPGTGNPKHMRENLGTYQMVDLTAEEMQEITDLRKDEAAKKFFQMQHDQS